MNDVEIWGGEPAGEPTDGRGRAMTEFLDQLIRDARSGAITFEVFDPKKPRLQTDSLPEYAAHGGPCPEPEPPGTCDCRTTNR